MKITVNNQVYTLAFQHRTGKLCSKQKRPPTLHRRIADAAKAITLCSVTGPTGIGLGMAVCDPADTFSRERGRLLALRDAISRLKGSPLQLLTDYYAAMLDQRKPKVPRQSTMTPERREELIAAGETRRTIRRVSRVNTGLA